MPKGGVLTPMRQLFPCEDETVEFRSDLFSTFAAHLLFFFCAGMGLVDARMRPDRTEGGGMKKWGISKKRIPVEIWGVLC